MQLTDSFGQEYEYNGFGDRSVQWARQLLGVKFRHQGRTISGVDCVGVVLHAWEGAGWNPLGDHSLLSGYARVPTAEDLENALQVECDQVPLSAIKKGDALSMAWENYCGGLPCHLALVSDIVPMSGLEGIWQGLPCVIQTHWEIKKVVEHPLDKEWRARVKGAYRPKGVE